MNSTKEHNDNEKIENEDSHDDSLVASVEDDEDFTVTSTESALCCESLNTFIFKIIKTIAKI